MLLSFQNWIQLEGLFTLPNFGLAISLFCLLGFLITFSRRLEPAIQLERIGIPIALVIGLIALLIGPYGKFHVLPQSVTEIWVQLPVPLLTLVFASLMIGRPIPQVSGLIKPIASQTFLALLLGFGQYLVGGLAVLFLLKPYFGVDPLMGCLIEIGFEGGHGAAAIMGDSLANLGFPEGLDLGLAMATLGLLCSTILGSALVVFGRWRGWLIAFDQRGESNTDNNSTSFTIIDKIKELFLNLAFVGSAVITGLLILFLIRNLAPLIGGLFEDVAIVFPVFPLALLGSLLIRFLLEITGKTSLVSEVLQREIGTLATDLLIITAMASLNLDLLVKDWLPLLVLAIAGLAWNLLGMLVFGPLGFREEWFERSLAEFGNATGVAASGLLLLRLADPREVTRTLPIFSIKQLLLQPLLSGGIITVIAPIAVNQIGLEGWTIFCGVLTLTFIVLSMLFNGNFSPFKAG